MTAVTKQQVMDAAVRANRRALQLLDQKIAEVSKVAPSVTDDLERARQSLPFSYLVDLSNAPGSNIKGQLVSGFVRVDSDSAFALAGIYVAPTVATSFHFNVFGMEMQITEENSGRQITIVGRDDRVVTSVLPTPSGIQMTALSVMNQLDRGSLRLPTECVFPRNALLRVDITASEQITFPSTINRNFIVLHGTKLFGG